MPDGWDEHDDALEPALEPAFAGGLTPSARRSNKAKCLRSCRGVSTTISWAPTPFIIVEPFSASSQFPFDPQVDWSWKPSLHIQPNLGRSLGGSRLCDLNDSGFYESYQIDPIHPHKVAMRSRVECDLLE